MSKLYFSVIGKNETETRIIGNSRQFTLTVDEPQELGGEDSAPNPVEYLLAGFAGCFNVVGHLVAKELGFKINSLEFDVSGDIDPDGFLGKSEEVRPGFQNIDLNIKIDANTDSITLAKWKTIVEKRCPVKDNISNPTPINVNIKEHARLVA